MESKLQEDILKVDESPSSGHDCDTSNSIYFYDVVRSKSCGALGIVTEVADEYNWYDSGLPSPNQIEVIWDNETDKKCVNRNDLTLVSKGYLSLGTIVASALDPSSQCGVVIDVNTFVDLSTADGTIIESVNTTELIHVKEKTCYNFVVLGPWLGEVVGVVDNVTVLFDIGFTSEFIKANDTSLEPIDHMMKIGDDVTNYADYYPGQRVKARFLSVFHKNPRFLPGLWKPECLEGTVVKVSVESVQIDWFAYAGQDACPPKPHEKQSFRNVKLLPYFNEMTWVLFVRCRLKNVHGVLKIVNMKKKVDVAWQDGTIEKGLDSTTLIVKRDITPQLFPKQFVRMKNSQRNSDELEIGRSGFIKSVNSKDKTALVRWRQGELEEEKEVSIYELEIHPKHNYFYGDLVYRSPSSYLPSEEADVTSTNGDLVDHRCFGHVTAIGNGLIDVSWMSGANSKVVPEDICKSEIYIGGGDDYYNHELEESETFLETSVALVDAMLVYTIRLLSMILWAIKCFIPLRLKSTGEEKGQCHQFSSSKGFDVIEELPSDHHFAGAEGQSNANRKWLKVVQEDWRRLQNDLPDGIFVRVYEDRMDLLRAMIVGPYGTPYHDGLFFFDFHLPPEYPDVPPEVHYNSGGWKINPNLNENGKICLSLLNTWHGKGNEVWISSSSSILQVLVSIQGLVLNSKPYFNEAGYDNLIGSKKGENDSLSYNESAYLLNCKSMMHTMRHPLKGFEELVREHFISRGYYILKTCNAYMKGYLIGCLSKDASPNENAKLNANSLGFKQTLATKLAPKLFFALDEIGADCSHFIHLQET